MPLSKDISFEVDAMAVGSPSFGIDKCEVGQMAAVIRMERPPEPYQGQGHSLSGRVCENQGG